MYYLLYFSVAAKMMQQPELLEILEHSRRSNKARDITGCLAYIEGRVEEDHFCRFIQVLEGPEQAVLDVYEKIENDPRHHTVTLVKQGIIDARNFASWEMGFEKVVLASNSMLKGFFELDPEILRQEGDLESNLLLDFMKSFNQQMFM